MACLEKLTWSNYSIEELEAIKIKKPNEQIYQKIMKHWDAIAKPLDSMGIFENVVARIGSIQNSEEVQIAKKIVVIMCADNGIVEEGVSQSGQDVTALVAKKMALGLSSVGKMASVIGADSLPVDIGINQSMAVAGLLSQKIRYGTRNFLKEPAMTVQETIRAISVGIQCVLECKKKGYEIIATGEMGIGNTTTSSTIAAVLLNCSVEEVTGKGAGLDEQRFLRKQAVIQEAIEKYDLRNARTLKVLSSVGGLDIAGLVGVCIGGALYQVPIVLDGVISLVAALVAERMKPGIKEYLIASHKGKEPAIDYLHRALGLTPVIDGKLALGEGTGAVMMLALLEVALGVYQKGTTFSDMDVEQYKRM